MIHWCPHAWIIYILEYDYKLDEIATFLCGVTKSSNNSFPVVSEKKHTVFVYAMVSLIVVIIAKSIVPSLFSTLEIFYDAYLMDVYFWLLIPDKKDKLGKI